MKKNELAELRARLAALEPRPATQAPDQTYANQPEQAPPTETTPWIQDEPGTQAADQSGSYHNDPVPAERVAEERCPTCGHLL